MFTLRNFRKVFLLSTEVALLSWFLSAVLLLKAASACSRWVVVEKSEKKLYLYENGKAKRVFDCSFGLDTDTPKRREGDLATPEGIYFVVKKRPSKNFYLFIELDYPNQKDISLAEISGRYPLKKLGNNIGIHGGGLYRRLRNWTYGCVALRNADIKVVYDFVSVGTPVLIYDKRKPLFEIFRELVIPKKIGRNSWCGRTSFELKDYGLVLELLVEGNSEGVKHLEILGLDLYTERVLFLLKDLNGNGVLEPYDEVSSLTEGLYLTYRTLQDILIERLPTEILPQLIGCKR